MKQWCGKHTIFSHSTVSVSLLPNLEDRVEIVSGSYKPRKSSYYLGKSQGTSRNDILFREDLVDLLVKAVHAYRWDSKLATNVAESLESCGDAVEKWLKEDLDNFSHLVDDSLIGDVLERSLQVEYRQR